MPATGVLKPTEIAKKKPGDSALEIKKKKSISKEGDHDKVEEEDASEKRSSKTVSQKEHLRSHTGIPKPKKNFEGEAKKRVGSSVIDKVPKKSAQRAKGSIALGKALAKAEAENAAKKRPPSASVDRIPRPLISDRDASQSSRPKSPDNPSRAQSLRKLKDLQSVDSKIELKKVPSKKRKAWVSVLEGDNTVTKTDESDEQKLLETSLTSHNRKDNTSIEGPPPSTCSFFERIQQGVRAYFSSRNSLTADTFGEDKNKKKVTEGGIHLD